MSSDFGKMPSRDIQQRGCTLDSCIHIHIRARVYVYAHRERGSRVQSTQCACDGWLVMNSFCERKRSKSCVDPQLQQCCGSWLFEMRSGGSRSLSASALRAYTPCFFRSPRFQQRHHSRPRTAPAMHRRPSYFFFFFFLATARTLFHSRDVIATCIFYETSLRPIQPEPTTQPSIHP